MVYSGLDISTAASAREVRERIRITWSICSIRPRAIPQVSFCTDAVEAIGAIQASPGSIAVGGTMLYFHTLLNGSARLPPADAQVRRELDARHDERRLDGIARRAGTR